ncbi:MAG: formate dehydrogenase, partial [Acidobacteria bacterium]|nr:formate dehydrogenase [Acidobacteriota bacterium]
HQDIVLSPQMFVEPGEEVLLLPAQTRYEQSGGGTETTTERRILLSPEIPGRRIGESRPEWWILMMAAERARPELRSRIHFVDAQDIREEMAKAVPFYKGIEKLRVEGDALQWGGPQLCQGGRFPTDNQRARFTAVDPPTHGLLPGTYLLSTRRGKQFNSMVQADRDPLTGARRDDVFISPEDARELGIADGEPILLRSKAGQFSGRCKIAAMNPGNLQIHWPEGNILIEHGIRDREAGIPDYNAVVEIVRLDPRDSGG